MAFTFTYEIKDFHEDKGFSVVYTPEDTDLQPVATWVLIPPGYSTEAEIEDQIASAAPQGKWGREKAALNDDKSVHRSLVGRTKRVEPVTPEPPPQAANVDILGHKAQLFIDATPSDGNTI